MKQRPPLPPGPYLVIGLARSGVAAALALRRADPTMSVAAVDAASSPELAESAKRLADAGVEVLLNTDGVAALTSAEPPQTVVKSPGVPVEAPVIAAARSHGLQVLGELELGWRLVGNEFCAVTGTNGKTTTVEMIGAIHRTAGLAGSRRRQRRRPAQLARRRDRPGRDGRLRDVELPAGGHRSTSRPRSACC